jgi:hypothetical protein
MPGHEQGSGRASDDRGAYRANALLADALTRRISIGGFATAPRMSTDATVENRQKASRCRIFRSSTGGKTSTDKTLRCVAKPGQTGIGSGCRALPYIRVTSSGTCATSLAAGPGAGAIQIRRRRRLCGAVDINPDRQNRYIPGSGRPIVSPARLQTLRPEAAVITNPLNESEIRKAVAELHLKCGFLTL